MYFPSPIAVLRIASMTCDAPVPGHPSEVNGSRPELNHVSSTSVSCVISAESQYSHTCGVSRATVIPPHFPQCHAGMRCPHHSWREMHQSWMLRIHSS